MKEIPHGVIIALKGLMLAQREHEKAYEKYVKDTDTWERVDWSYDKDGRTYIQRLEREAEAFGEALSDYIDERVNAVLESKNL